MGFIKENGVGMAFCLALASVACALGTALPLVGGPVFGILVGMCVALVLKSRGRLDAGIRFTSKKILQYAVVLLGFGLDLKTVLETGAQSLPIILSTVAASLVVAYVVGKLMRVPAKTATLVGVGSSICGGSAIAATAPVIRAGDEEVAQSVSIIFFFNVLAAIIFPHLGSLLGFSTVDGTAFGIFAGTAVNDTSSVTACAATWDSMWGLGSATLDEAVTVKLTRTLAIIPITFVLSLVCARRSADEGGDAGGFSLKRAFPMFILFFLAASAVTTVATAVGIPAEAFNPLKTLSKLMIVWAMVAIGLNTDVVKLVKTAGKPLLLGFCCWCGIIAVSLGMQQMLGIW